METSVSILFMTIIEVKIMGKNRKLAEEFILKRVGKMDKSGRSGSILKEQFSKMDDERFDIWMKEIRDGKNYVPIWMPNGMDNKITTEHALKVCKEVGVQIFQRYWYRDQASGVKALSNNPVPVLYIPVRRQIETLLNKMSTADNNNRFDTLTGQPLEAASAITQPENLVYEEKGLDGSLIEKMKYRGGDISGGRMFDKSLIETGQVSTEKLMEEHPSVTRVVQTADIYLTGAHYETNLDPTKFRPIK